MIVAHADDTEFMAGGTIAKMAALGYETGEAIATNNELYLIRRGLLPGERRLRPRETLRASG